MGGVGLSAHDRPLVLIPTVGNGPVGLPPIGMHGRSRLDRTLDERDQAVLGDVVDTLAPDPSKTLGMLDLDSDRDDRLGVGLPTEHPSFDSTQVRLVNLDVARQPVASGAHHRGPVAVQHRPRRLVGPQPQRPLDPECGDAVLLTGHLPCRSEPQPQRRASAVQDRPRRDRRLTTADRALPTTAAQSPPSPAGAPRAPESGGPAQPLKVINARSLVRKPRQQLRKYEPG
jgi:hypothetical protein